VGVPLIGRDQDLAYLDAQVAQGAIVTITGPGGVGKTRLASEWVDRTAGDVAGGARLVSLAGDADSEATPARAVGRLGFRSFDAFRLSVSATPTVVVLDNCESAPGAARAMAAALTSPGSEARVLATSREALHALGEQVMVLEPLAFPPAGHVEDEGAAPAVELFVRLALAAGAGWDVDHAPLDDVAELVRSLDGLPLAIELAAARMRALTPGDLLRLFDRRLDLLARPAGAAPGRHTSLRAAIDTSYDLLPEGQQRLLRRMAVFPGPVDLDLVRRVAGEPGSDVVDVVDDLTQLVDRSLVVADHSAGAVARYRLYDSIRAYAGEQLDVAGERDAVRDRYVDELAAVADEFVTEALRRWSPELIADIVERVTHLTTAIEWSLDDPTPARAYRLVIPLYGPTHGSHAATVAGLAHQVFERWDGRDTPLRAEALAVGATAMLMSGDLAGADDHGRAALADGRATPLARMMAHRSLGYVRTHQGDRDAGLAHLAAAIDEAADHPAFRRELEVSWAAIGAGGPPRPGGRAGSSAGERDEDDRRALALLERVAAEAAAAGDVVNQAWARVVAVNLRLRTGDVAEAVRDADAVLRLADRGAVAYFVAAGHRAKAMVLAYDGDWDASVDHWRAALRHTMTTGDVEGLVLTVDLAAAATAACGRDDLARELWSVAPPGEGHTVLPSPFPEAQAALAALPRRHATTGLDESYRRAMALLAAPAGRAAARPAAARGEARPGAAAPASRRVGRVVRFEDCELDIGRHELRRGGRVVKVEPQVFDVLVLLTHNHGQLVTKHDLLDQVWGDRFVSESALTSRIRTARRAVGDDGTRQRVIRTVHGRGYIFVAEVITA
jgi:predicted ATPase/DNA-binding winged helix-turn-helix (wHTH) protein